jgi:anti-sigma factor RsiW
VSDVERREWSCEVARRSIHRRLDGEALGDGERRQLDRHLDSCAECRESDEDLRAILGGLRAIPQQTMPDGALQEVFDRTVRADRAGRKRTLRRWGVDWRMAAAAVVTAGVIGIWFAFYPPAPRPAEPTQAELAQAAEDARMVLGLTAQALRRVPIRWPSPDSTSGGGRPLL